MNRRVDPISSIAAPQRRRIDSVVPATFAEKSAKSALARCLLCCRTMNATVFFGSLGENRDSMFKLLIVGAASLAFVGTLRRTCLTRSRSNRLDQSGSSLSASILLASILSARHPSLRPGVSRRNIRLMPSNGPCLWHGRLWCVRALASVRIWVSSQSRAGVLAKLAQ